MENEQNKKTPDLGSEVSTPTAIVTDKAAPVNQSYQQPAKSVNDIDAFIGKRTEFIQKVNAICVEGKDYHVIQGKKSLAKGGAEKIAAIFGWTAKFAKDQETYEMLSKSFPNDALVAYYCWLTKPIGAEFHTLGQGRGAALLSKNGKDPNKTIKMAQKSAFIDAVLRTSGLSDFFTQDLEDMPNVQTTHQAQPAPSQATAVAKATDKQVDLIQRLKQQKGYNSNEVVAALKIDVTKVFDTKSASMVIDWLTKAPSKVAVGGWDNVGPPNV